MNTESISVSEGGSITVTGQRNMTFLRLLHLKSAMKLEAVGIFGNVNPWKIAKDELGIIGTNEEVLEIITMAIHEGPDELIDKMIEFSQRPVDDEEDEIETLDPASGDPNRVLLALADVFDITVEQVCGLLCTAFEGGSGHWVVKCGDLHVRPKGEMIPTSWKEYPSYSWCFGDGKVILCDREEYFEKGRNHLACEKWELNEEKIIAGIKVMAKKHKEHFNDAFILDNADGNTGDVFLQCCVFGEVVY